MLVVLRCGARVADRGCLFCGGHLADLEWMREALKHARSHVVRQSLHGKHEQDRIDAEEWLLKWGEQTSAKPWGVR
jgi:hypothetical protein